LAYAGIPYQSLGERAGALVLMIAWSRSPMARYGSGIAAIAASTALSPSALSVALDDSFIEAFIFPKTSFPSIGWGRSTFKNLWLVFDYHKTKALFSRGYFFAGLLIHGFFLIAVIFEVESDGAGEREECNN
jgi:hypothetical protein